MNIKERNDWLLQMLGMFDVEGSAGVPQDLLFALLGGRMLLFPDMSRTQHEADEFCFCQPCQKSEWDKLMSQCQLPHDEHIPFVMKEDEDETVCLILRRSYDSDDDCLTTAAWIRMVMEFTGMIYAVPFTAEANPKAMADIIASVAGVPPEKVRHIDL